MSSDAETVAAIAATQFSTSCLVATTALYFYEYLITFDSEASLFWNTKLAGPSILFLLNRYLAFVVRILALAPLPPSLQGYIALSIAYAIVLYSQYFPWAAFSALRSYALYEGHHRWAISATVFVLSLGPAVFNLVTLYWVSYVNDPTEGFQAISTLSEKLRTRFTLASRISLVTADLVVLCVTWYRTYETVKLSRGTMAGRGKRSIAGTLLRDGTLYFLPLLIFNILDITFGFTLETYRSTIIYFSEPITAILTSRFLINLQQVKRRLEGHSLSLAQEDIVLQAPDLSGAAGGFIGSLGAQLSFHGDDVEDWGERSS